MNKLIYLLSISLLLPLSLLASGPKVFFHHATFNIPEQDPYLETYLSILGNSVTYKATEGDKFQAAVEMTMAISTKEDPNTFIYAKKFKILSPEITDTINDKRSFTDLRRVSLKEGEYQLELSLADLNQPGDTVRTTQKIKIGYPGFLVSVSDFQLIESYKKSTEQSLFTKGGYDMIPYASNFFPESAEKLIFYSEIYNTDKFADSSEQFLINYFIEDFESKKTVGDYRRFKKSAVGSIVPVLGQFDIHELPSGNYNIVLEARDRQNQVISSNKYFFQRVNTRLDPKAASLEDVSSVKTTNTFVDAYNNIDTLTAYIRSLDPISGQREVTFADNQIEAGNIDMMKRYFYNFWVTRNAVDPAGEWHHYQQLLAITDREFSTKIRRGYETDRGRVYLKYGPPNTINRNDNEPSAYPYEIWHYHKLESQTNRRFVFYNRDLVTNDYELIHSDAIGERFNDQWQTIIYRRTTDWDQQRQQHFGSTLDDIYNTPR